MMCLVQSFVFDQNMSMLCASYVCYTVFMQGAHKIVSECGLPLTGKNCVDLIITDMVSSSPHTQHSLSSNSLHTHTHITQGVFEVNRESGLTLTELADGVSLEDIRAATGSSFKVW